MKSSVSARTFSPTEYLTIQHTPATVSCAGSTERGHSINLECARSIDQPSPSQPGAKLGWPLGGAGVVDIALTTKATTAATTASVRPEHVSGRMDAGSSATCALDVTCVPSEPRVTSEPRVSSEPPRAMSGNTA